MDSENIYVNSCQFPKEDLLIPKVEPIDTDIMMEEKCAVEPRVIVSSKMDKVLVKEELCENLEYKNSLSSKV